MSGRMDFMVLFKDDLSHDGCVIHARARERRRPNRAVDGFSGQRMIAAEVSFPGDAFRWSFDAENGKRDHDVCVPAFGFCIDAGFAKPVAVPGGIVFPVARIHDVGDPAVESVILARGVCTLREAVKQRLCGIGGQVKVESFLVGENAVAAEGGERLFVAEFGLGADVQSFVIVEEAQCSFPRQRVQRRKEREFVREGVLPFGRID